MQIGRFFCVALPFILLLASIIALVIAATAGVTNKGLYMFSVDLKDMSLDPLDDAILDKLGLNLDGIDLDNLDTDSVLDKLGIDLGFLNNRRRAETSNNITAKALGLDKQYDISVWGFCSTNWKNKRVCKDPEWDWAAKYIDKDLKKLGKNKNVNLPDEIKDAVKVFKTATKWTQYAFVVAFVALLLEAILGIFTGCSRIVSCVVWIVSGIATTLVITCLGVTAATAGVVVGAIKSTAELYGAEAHFNNTFFIVLAFSAAFALGASLFWIFTICCCKPESRSSKRSKNRHSDGEKLLGGSNGKYAPLGNDHEMTSGGFYNHNQSSSQYGAPRYPSGAARSDLAYEPYSHRA